jgi:hypothetical protein
VHLTAVDDQAGAEEEAGLVGSEECHDGGDLVRASDSAEGDSGGEL